ncbi:hypothetical protein [Flagellimonas flava]|uniref:hypothetical protein n=1 Tax=Flagellimonas flava TaxID=570519 RepID=UPI003D6523DD
MRNFTLKIIFAFSVFYIVSCNHEINNETDAPSDKRLIAETAKSENTEEQNKKLLAKNQFSHGKYLADDDREL